MGIFDLAIGLVAIGSAFLVRLGSSTPVGGSQVEVEGQTSASGFRPFHFVEYDMPRTHGYDNQNVGTRVSGIKKRPLENPTGDYNRKNIQKRIETLNTSPQQQKLRQEQADKEKEPKYIPVFLYGNSWYYDGKSNFITSVENPNEIRYISEEIAIAIRGPLSAYKPLSELQQILKKVQSEEVMVAGSGLDMAFEYFQQQQRLQQTGRQQERKGIQPQQPETIPPSPSPYPFSYSSVSDPSSGHLRVVPTGQSAHVPPVVPQQQQNFEQIPGQHHSVSGVPMPGGIVQPLHRQTYGQPEQNLSYTVAAPHMPYTGNHQPITNAIPHNHQLYHPSTMNHQQRFADPPTVVMRPNLPNVANTPITVQRPPVQSREQPRNQVFEQGQRQRLNEEPQAQSRAFTDAHPTPTLDWKIVSIYFKGTPYEGEDYKKLTFRHYLNVLQAKPTERYRSNHAIERISYMGLLMKILFDKTYSIIKIPTTATVANDGGVVRTPHLDAQLKALVYIYRESLSFLPIYRPQVKTDLTTADYVLIWGNAILLNNTQIMRLALHKLPREMSESVPFKGFVINENYYKSFLNYFKRFSTNDIDFMSKCFVLRVNHWLTQYVEEIKLDWDLFHYCLPKARLNRLVKVDISGVPLKDLNNIDDVKENIRRTFPNAVNDIKITVSYKPE